MSETNPYEAPQSDVAAPIPETYQFKDLDFKQLKKLYYRSCNVNGITGLLVLGLIFIVIASFMPDIVAEGLQLVFIGLAVFYAVTIFGLFKRTSWGRILGIIVCIISLINIPIGTLIGVLGLFAFFGAPELFGPDRVLHKDLKSEFKLRKKNKT
ncbi:MAG: hypothetical protein AAGJ79_08500 [Verrucomicrobiota bacterium]